MLQYTQITNLIAELLYKHDCVIVPNFGGFVARNYNSSFSKGNNLLYPQAKHVLFNKNLIHNDGLLVTALMEKVNLPYSDAEKQITDYKDYIQSLLSVKKRFELNNIGLLYVDAENSLRFEAKTDVNFLLESFGFEPVIANELVIEPEKPIFEKQFEDRKSVVVPAKRKRSYAKIATLAVGIPLALSMLLLAALSKPMQPILHSSLNPFYSPEKTYTPTKETSHKAYFIKKAESAVLLADVNGFAPFTMTENGNVLIANLNDSVSRIDKTSVCKPIHTLNNNGINVTGKFQVVLGCFGVIENAYKLISELQAKQISAGISGTNAKGLHVVSCGGFNSKEEASTVLATVKSSYPNAWIMMK